MRKFVLALLLALATSQGAKALNMPGTTYASLRTLDLLHSPFIRVFGLPLLTVAMLDYIADPPPLPPVITIRNYDPAKFRIYRWWSERTVYIYTFNPNGTLAVGAKSISYYNVYLGWRARMWNWIPTESKTWVEQINPQFNKWSLTQLWDPTADGYSSAQRYTLLGDGSHTVESERIVTCIVIQPIKAPTFPTEVLVTMDGASYPLGEFSVPGQNTSYWTDKIVHLYDPLFTWMEVTPKNKVPNYDILGFSLTPPMLMGL